MCKAQLVVELVGWAQILGSEGPYWAGSTVPCLVPWNCWAPGLVPVQWSCRVLCLDRRFLAESESINSSM